MAGLRIRAVGLSEIAAHPYLSLDPKDYLDEGDEVEAATETFDPQAATRRAQEVIGLRAAELNEQILGEGDAATTAARAYAEHLAKDGHPWVTPGVDGTMRWRNRGEIISPYFGLVPVYLQWNEARDSTNPLLPFQDAQKWQVAEKFYERLGEPIPYAEIGGAERARKMSPTALQDLLKEVAAQDPTVVPRRTKLDGKVAYYLRPRRDGDEDEIKDGRYRGDIREEDPDGSR